MKKVVIYTDGSSKGNPGHGGWGVVLSYGKHKRLMSGYEPDTTNNRMELKAAIVALSTLKETCEVDVYTDSKYVIEGITSWIDGWKRKLYKGVKNAELWIELDKLNRTHSVKWIWVKGHNGDRGNELADKLATGAAMSRKPYEERREGEL